MLKWRQNGRRWVFLCLLVMGLMVAQTNVGFATPSSSEIFLQRFPGHSIDPATLQATSAMVVDLNTGAILFEHNADAPMGPASLVKIATLTKVYQALEAGTLHLDDRIAVSENAWSVRVPGSKMFIEVGEKILVSDMMRGIAVASGNDASIAMAEHLGRTEAGFVSQLNQLATDLGLQDTVFRNSHGLSVDGQITTARDMARLTRFFSVTYPQSVEITSQQYFEYGIELPHRHWNGLLFKDSRVVGLKTGFTSASGFHLVATARDQGQFFAAIVMGIGIQEEMEYNAGMAAREDEAQRLLDWAFSNFAAIELPLDRQMPEELRVYGGEPLFVSLVPSDSHPRITMPKGSLDRVQYSLQWEDPLHAPLTPADSLGSIEAHWVDGDNEILLGQWTLHPGESVETAGLWRRIWDRILLFFLNIRSSSNESGS